MLSVLAAGLTLPAQAEDRPASSQTSPSPQPTMLPGVAPACLVVEPEFADFGEISRSAKSLERVLVLRRGDNGPIVPKIVKPLDHWAYRPEIVEIEAGEKYELHIVAKVPLKFVRVRSYLELETGVPESPRMMILIQGAQAPRLCGNPRFLEVPENREGPWSAKLDLAWDGPPADIVKVSIDDPALQVTFHTRPLSLSVEVPSGYVPANWVRMITLLTNDREAPVVNIPIYFAGLAPPPPSTPVLPTAHPSTPSRVPVPATPPPAGAESGPAPSLTN